MNIHNPAPRISVVIPTLNRHRALARALASLAGQRDLPPGDDFEVVVVDNSTDANARALVAEISADAAVPIRYSTVPEPGVASARNAGVAAAAGDWIAFLDDDETAGPTWLATLLEVARETGADAVFGPVGAKPEDGGELGPMEAYFSRRLECPDRAEITEAAAYLGTNNSMFSRAACLSVAGPFEPRLNSVGGEDSLLLRRLVMAGRRFAWASEAGITEWVPARRMTWAYIRKRKFLSGQIRTFVNAMVEPPRPKDVALWMMVGAVQAALAGAVAMAVLPFRRPAAYRFGATAWGGLGKVFWMSRFRPTLYGTGLVS